jgi:cytochrome b6-f complex iron-sulfur subunit
VANASHPTRRNVLLGAGATGLAGLTLAACGSSSSGSAGSAGTSASSSSAGTTLATLADIPVGTAVASKDAAGKPIIVAQPTAGRAVAFSAICTHMACTVAPAGKQLNCPCHGSQYDATTGKVLRGPAPRPLPSIPVHVANGKVIAGSA